MFFDSEDGEEGTILPKKAPVKEEVKPVANAKPAAPVKKAEDPKKSQTNAKSNNKPNSREGKNFFIFKKLREIEKGLNENDKKLELEIHKEVNGDFFAMGSSCYTCERVKFRTPFCVGWTLLVFSKVRFPRGLRLRFLES